MDAGEAGTATSTAQQNPATSNVADRADLGVKGGSAEEELERDDFDMDNVGAKGDAVKARPTSVKAALLDSLGSSRPTVLPARCAEQALHFLACYETRADFDNALRSYHLTLKNTAGFVNFNGTSSPTCVCVVCCHESRHLGGARASNFLSNLVSDLVSSGCVCGFICQAQRITRKNLALRQWRQTALAAKCPSHVSGSVASKKEEQRKLPPKNLLPPSSDSEEMVWVVTLFNPHSGSDCVRGAVDFKPLDDESACLSGEATSTTHPSSAAALEGRRDNRYRPRRGPTGEQLAASVREKFEAMGVDPLNLSTEDLKSHLTVEYNAGSAHRLVRRALREKTPQSPSSSITQVLHVLVDVAKKEMGHYAKVHYATAAELNAWQVEAARARFKKLWKQSHPGKRCPAFDPKAAGMVPFLDFHPVTGEKMLYVKGWSLIPCYMLDGIKHFCGVTAVDAAFGKSRKFPSTFYVEGCLDANSHVHPVCVTHCLGDTSHPCHPPSAGCQSHKVTLPFVCMPTHLQHHTSMNGTQNLATPTALYCPHPCTTQTLYCTQPCTAHNLVLHTTLYCTQPCTAHNLVLHTTLYCTQPTTHIKRHVKPTPCYIPACGQLFVQVQSANTATGSWRIQLLTATKVI